MKMPSLEHDSPKDFVMSQWQKEPKSVYFFTYRILMVPYFVSVAVLSTYVSIERNEFFSHFFYLTTWGVWTNLLNSVLGASLVLAYQLNLIKFDNCMTWPLKFYWVLTNICIVYAFCASISYWILGYEGQKMEINNVVKHATNSLILIIDLFIIKQPYRFSHIMYSLGYGICYGLSTFIYCKLRNDGALVYSLIDWNDNQLQAMILSVFSTLFALINFCFVFCLHSLRSKIYLLTIKSKNVISFI